MEDSDKETNYLTSSTPKDDSQCDSDSIHNISPTRLHDCDVASPPFAKRYVKVEEQLYSESFPSNGSRKLRRKLTLGMEDFDEETNYLTSNTPKDGSQCDSDLTHDISSTKLYDCVVASPPSVKQYVKVEEQPYSESFPSNGSKKLRRKFNLEIEDSDEETNYLMSNTPKDDSQCDSELTQNLSPTELHDCVVASPPSVKQYVKVEEQPNSESFPSNGFKNLRRKFILEMEDSDEETNYMMSNTPKDDSPCDSDLRHNLSQTKLHDCVVASPPFVKLDDCVAQPCIKTSEEYIVARPIIDPIWRGRFSLICDVQYLSFELFGHLSNKASLKVHGVVSALPEFINLKIVPKYKAWPKVFNISPPTSKDIDLYFLPVNERDEEMYNVVLGDLIADKLVLTSKINNLDLLLFSSRELPHEQWRIQRNYYIWGVFMPNQDFS
ncbi:hypothetical protein BVRB_6g133040 [Beta vulgaris subsp. vulgaris]|nr:hypothetical protein BVRB_6g133040 [Beta vulgaris subsp. vulgaris]